MATSHAQKIQLVKIMAVYSLIPVAAIFVKIYQGTIETPAVLGPPEAPASQDGPARQEVPEKKKEHPLELQETHVSPNAEEVILFAQQFKGYPYKYACADPDKGFDCSGYVQYVFRHFDIMLPRSSAAFNTAGQTVKLARARPGDIILFTGTNSDIREVGHVGIITHTQDSIAFLHASSGKVHAVMESTLTPHYAERYVKVIRVLV